MSSTTPVEQLIELVAAGESIDRAETQVGLADETARSLLVAYARERAMGPAALARVLNQNRHTVKSWFRRYGDDEPPAAAPQPRLASVEVLHPPATPARSAAPRKPLPPSQARQPPPRSPIDEPLIVEDLARMDREQFLEWMVQDIGSRLQQTGIIAAGTAPQLISQLRQARESLDDFRAENKTKGSDLPDDITEDELREKMTETAEALPDHYLELYVQVYIERHRLQLVQRASSGG